MRVLSEERLAMNAQVILRWFLQQYNNVKGNWKDKIKKMLNRGERSNNYLAHLCKLLWNVDGFEKVEKQKLSISTVAFFRCRG